MTFIPILLAGALLVLAAAFGLHCFVLHCDQKRGTDHPLEHDSPFRRA